MKKLILLISIFILSLCNCYSEINYDGIIKLLKTEIKEKNNNAKSIKEQLKNNPNDVSLHKTLVLVNTDIELLENKIDKVKYAKTKYNELIKQNKKLDEEKTKLLKIKQESLEADEEVLEIIQQK